MASSQMFQTFGSACHPHAFVFVIVSSASAHAHHARRSTNASTGLVYAMGSLRMSVQMSEKKKWMPLGCIANEGPKDNTIEGSDNVLVGQLQ